MTRHEARLESRRSVMKAECWSTGPKLGVGANIGMNVAGSLRRVKQGIVKKLAMHFKNFNGHLTDFLVLEDQSNNE